MLRDMAMKEQCALVHELTVAKGFWDHEYIYVDVDPIIGALTKTPDGLKLPNPSIYEEKIALIHSEATEILLARRDENWTKEAEECADVVIRVMDYCAARGFDLGQEYVKKMRKNQDRPRLHGHKR